MNLQSIRGRWLGKEQVRSAVTGGNRKEANNVRRMHMAWCVGQFPKADRIQVFLECPLRVGQRPLAAKWV